MAKLQSKHPLAARWFHWLNFPILMVMIWSGLLIYWANDTYRIGWGDFTLVKFFPTWVYEKFQLERKLAAGMEVHFLFMWLFAINGVLYVLYTAISGQWRHLVPRRGAMREAWRVVLYDLKLSKVQPPQKKYNGAQQITYTSIILMGLGSLLTGLAIYKPIQLGWLCALFGGYQIARAIHFALTIGYCLFFIVHLLQVFRAGWNNFRAMITGSELMEEEAPDA